MKNLTWAASVIVATPVAVYWVWKWRVNQTTIAQDVEIRGCICQ